jgi:hypothetical protein
MNCIEKFLAFSALVVSHAFAGTASDPTQPSPIWLAAKAKTADASKGSDNTKPADAAKAAQASRAAQPAPQAQIILFSDERKIAVVDGVMVRPGDTFRGDRLVDMKRNEVRWKREDTQRPDTPRPAIVKKIVKPGGAE